MAAINKVSMTKGDKPGRENWVSDADVSSCKGCKTKFSLFCRRHHCRACGNVYCKSCTSFEIGLHRDHYSDGVEKQKRVCAWCFKTLAGQRHNLVRNALVSPGRENENAEAEDGGSFMVGSLSALHLEDRPELVSPRAPGTASEAQPLRAPTLLAPPVAGAPLKASSFQSNVRQQLALPPQVSVTPPSDNAPPALPHSLAGASAFKASCFEDGDLPASAQQRAEVATGTPASTPRSFRAPSSVGATSDEEEEVASFGPRPGDMSEFSGPQWEAFNELHSATAAAFQGCAEALADPKVWENKAELLMKSLRVHMLKIPSEDLRVAPGRSQVLHFVNQLEARRTLYRRQTAEIREKLG